jgi:hypothetical protein
MKYLNQVLAFSFVLFVLSACTDNRLKIDVSGMEAKVDIFRLDEILFENDMNIQKHIELQAGLGDFYKNYVEQMINAGPVEDSLAIMGINAFINDADIKLVKSKVAEKYQNIDWLNAGFSDAFKHYKHYFPERKTPTVTTYISGFNYALSTTEETLGIGLDMYLGKESEYYAMLGYPQYRTNLMNKDYIVSDGLKGWVSSEFEFDPIDADLLTQIVHYGKIQYVLDALLPNTPDSIKIGFSTQQLDWCKYNETNVWAHFIDQKLLFSNNAREIMKYINEGPFSPGFHKDSPARIGVWIGWKIVHAYMEKQSSVDLNKLMETDAKTILKESKYKPKN